MTSTMTEDDLASVLERLPALVNQNARLVRRGRFFSEVFAVGCAGLEILVKVHEGALRSALRGPFPMRSRSFTVRAGVEVWRRFWQPVPEPGYNDLLAMSRFGTASIEGDLRPFMANLRYVKEVLEAPRRAGLDRLLGGPGDGG